MPLARKSLCAKRSLGCGKGVQAIQQYWCQVMRHGQIGLPHRPKPRASVSLWYQVAEVITGLVLFASVIIVLVVGGSL